MAAAEDFTNLYRIMVWRAAMRSTNAMWIHKNESNRLMAPQPYSPVKESREVHAMRAMLVMLSLARSAAHAKRDIRHLLRAAQSHCPPLKNARPFVRTHAKVKLKQNNT